MLGAINIADFLLRKFSGHFVTIMMTLLTFNVFSVCVTAVLRLSKMSRRMTCLRSSAFNFCRSLYHTDQMNGLLHKNL